MAHPGQPGRPLPSSQDGVQRSRALAPPPLPPQAPPQGPFGQPGPLARPGPFGQSGPLGGPGGPAPAARPGRGRRIGSVAAALAVAGGIAALRFLDLDAPDVGDCVQRLGIDIATVDCADPAAQLRVVGIEEQEVTEAEFHAEDYFPCTRFASATDALWRSGAIGSGGTVYCAEPVG